MIICEASHCNTPKRPHIDGLIGVRFNSADQLHGFEEKLSDL